MRFSDVFNQSKYILLEGAVGERLKSEFNVVFDDYIDMAGLVRNMDSRKAMQEIYSQYIEIADKYNLPIMLTTPTRRANQERINQSLFDEHVIRENVAFLRTLKKENSPLFVGGLMGCKGDAYSGADGLNLKESYEFHKWQADLFLKAEVDYLLAGIMPALKEAVGMAKAMAQTNLPYIISFMLDDSGCLLDGTTLSDAIELIDAAVNPQPLCYICNCVHPKRVASTLAKAFNRTANVNTRFKGVQVNAANLSHQSLDQIEGVVSSAPKRLTEDVWSLFEYNKLKIIGGCCGTTNLHIEAFARKMVEK